jgi:hypothetical protein
VPIFVLAPEAAPVNLSHLVPEIKAEPIASRVVKPLVPTEVTSHKREKSIDVYKKEKSKSRSRLDL